ncbi:hypothetical protein [Embleya sp. NPDC020630]|uniref:hypothetical protein n=1 Tax=Embleya sp. NPDC020630 TaxID=3363979 RepID=UPI003797B1D1
MDDQELFMFPMGCQKRPLTWDLHGELQQKLHEGMFGELQRHSQRTLRRHTQRHSQRRPQRQRRLDDRRFK